MELNDRALSEPFQFILYNLNIGIFVSALIRPPQNFKCHSRCNDMPVLECLRWKTPDKGFCCDQGRFYCALSYLPFVLLWLQRSKCTNALYQCNNLAGGKNWGVGSQAWPQAGLRCPFIIRGSSCLSIWRKEGQWGLKSRVRRSCLEPQL